MKFYLSLFQIVNEQTVKTNARKKKKTTDDNVVVADDDVEVW